MVIKKATLLIAALVILALLLWTTGLVCAAVTDYKYIESIRTANMSAAVANNGRGFAVNNRTGSPYYGWIYYCCRSGSPLSNVVDIYNPTTKATTSYDIATDKGNTVPHDCAVDPVDDGVYVTGLFQRAIYKMKPDGSSASVVIANTGLPDDPAPLSPYEPQTLVHCPRAICVTGSGTNRTLYIAAETEGQVWASNDSGNTFVKVRSLSVGNLGRIVDITADTAGNVYMIDWGGNAVPALCIVKFNKDGQLVDQNWAAPIKYPSFQNGSYFKGIEYVNNSLGEFILVIALNGTDYTTGEMRVYRYRMDGSFADGCGFGIGTDNTLKTDLYYNNGNYLTYTSVQGNYLYVNAGMMAGTGVITPQFVKIEMPALPAAGSTPRSPAPRRRG
jgi:hypothetical protein